MNKKLRNSILLFTFVAGMLVTGCNKTPDATINNQTNIEEDTTGEVDQEDTLEESEGENVGEVIEAINNGGRYVKYNENVYFREYTLDSNEPVGIFGTYEVIPGSLKNMMCKKPDGTTEVAFEDTGDGEIYIYQDRMYLQEYDENYVPTVYAVDLDGGNKQEIGSGWVKGIDENTGTLICILADENDTYQLYGLDETWEEAQLYELDVPCAEFLALKDGVIYYSGQVEFEDSQYGKIKLCSVNVDGTEEKLLAETDANMYESAERGYVISCMQIVEDTIYFDYGTYAGTGNFFQGGRIAKVEKDGSGFEFVVGGDIAEENSGVIGEEFYYATNEDGNGILYYSIALEETTNYALNMSTREVAETDFTFFAEGKPFEYEDGIGIFLDASSQMTTWIPVVDYSYLNLEKESDYYTIKDIELCDNWVYYKLEANDSEPDASIGWRDGYRRVKTVVLRQELDGQTVEVLVEY